MKRLLLVLTLLPVIILSCKPPVEKEGIKEKSFPEFKLVELWASDTILLTSESVLFDKSSGFLFVSCINNTPGEKDGNGFISRLRADGSIEDLYWASGLNAPKGMGIYQNMLYVTDIDELVIIELETGAIREKIAIDGASFLNDISVDSDGTVYFSDSDTGKIFKYINGEVKIWISEELNRPNGLFIEKDRVLLTSSGSQDLKILNKKTGEQKVVTTGIGAGDGVEYTGFKDYYITSSWSGEVFLIYPDFSKKSLLKTSDIGINSADIGMDPVKHIVYVPTFFKNGVVAYQLEKIEDK